MLIALAVPPVSQAGRRYRIGTITPRMVRTSTGRACTFLDQAGRCTVHPVAPFGCAYFDTHMGRDEGQRRGNYLAQATTDPAYQALRKTLPFADSYKPTKY